MAVHFGTVISSTTSHSVPAICETRELAKEGGLISYGADYADIFRRAASYVDRILRGEKPADLPVQAPIKFELTVNLKSARALGIDVPSRLLAIADEVIE
jgi:putative ABC transport system substrate-binding protein